MKVLKIKKVEASMDPEVSIHQIIVEVKILGKVNGNIQCGRELGAQIWGFRMWDQLYNMIVRVSCSDGRKIIMDEGVRNMRGRSVK